MAGSRDFGKIINERRLSLGYSLGQLANRMGTTATKVRSWERGDAVPDDATMEQLAEELNMSPGVLRATLPESEPQLDEVPDDATSVVAAAAHSGEPESTGAAVASDHEAAQPATPAGLADDSEADDHDDGREASDHAARAESDEEEPEEPVGDDQQPTAMIAATSPTGDDGDEGAGGAGPDAAAMAEGDDAGTGDDDTDEQQLLLDAPTEAVAVVPSGASRESVGSAVVAAAPARVAAPQTRVDLNDVGVPEPTGLFAPIERAMAVVFDPDKNYLMWIRLVLIILVFFIMLRVLSWAVPEFFDALKDILDTIESTPTEPDPAREFIEGLGRITGA